MAQRDYISNKSRPARTPQRRTTDKQSMSRSPAVLIALVVLVVSIFLGGLYFITRNAPVEQVEQQRTPAENQLPPPPEQRWQYIRNLESNSNPVDSVNNNAPQNSEQAGLDALIQHQMAQQNGEVIAPNSALGQETLNPSTDMQNQQLLDTAQQLQQAQLPNQGQQDFSQQPNLNQSIPSAAGNLTNSTNLETEGIQQANNNQVLLNQQGQNPNVNNGVSINATTNNQEQQNSINTQAELLAAQQKEIERLANESAKKQAEEAKRLEAKKLEAQQKLAEQKKAEEKKLAEQKQQAVQKANNWQLQCGSFQAVSQAESVRAKLAFSGIESRIVPAGNWNRVMLGPFQDRNSANNMIQNVKSVGVTNCLILAP